MKWALRAVVCLILLMCAYVHDEAFWGATSMVLVAVWGAEDRLEKLIGQRRDGRDRL